MNQQATKEIPTVRMAEIRKEKWWNEHVEGLNIIAGAIDTYGRNGDQLNQFIKEAAGYGSMNDQDFSKKVFRLRMTVAWMHARVIGKQQREMLQTCYEEKRSHQLVLTQK